MRDSVLRLMPMSLLQSQKRKKSMPSACQSLNTCDHSLLDVLTLVALLLTTTMMMSARELRPVSVKDCVGMEKITEGPVISPDGTRFVFLTTKPDARSNHNVYQLRSSTLSQPGSYNGRIIFTSHERLSGLRWLRNGEQIAVLVGRNTIVRKHSRIVVMDYHRGVISEEIKEAGGITDYSISRDGTTVAYFSPVAPSESTLSSLGLGQGHHGVLVDEHYSELMTWERGGVQIGPASLWIVRISVATQRQLKSEVPLPADASDKGPFMRGFHHGRGLSLSPNGSYLALAYQRLSSLERWNTSSTVRSYEHDFGVSPHGLALFDVIHGRFLNGPSFPFPSSEVWWSDDSLRFAVLSVAPLGSKWEADDENTSAGARSASMYHVFSEAVKTGEVSEVLRPTQIDGAVSVISWQRANSDLLVQTGTAKSAFERLAFRDDKWVIVTGKLRQIEFPLRNLSTRDGIVFLGVHEDSQHPPDIWRINLGIPSEPTRLTGFNLGMKSLAFGAVEEISWKNRFDFPIRGKLILPPYYTDTIRYPLIIMLTWPDDEFVCDCRYSTAFAPQPLASAGFVVVIFNVYDAFFPSGLAPAGPPQTKEAESTVASVESLVDTLDRRKMIDKSNVGIVGFSRSSWKVDYLLTHSSLRLRAASSADGGGGEYGTLWMYDGGDIAESIEKGYGGVFVGEARAAWLAGSPAFNADKTTAPLLMEYSGNGLSDEPHNAYEFHAALKSQGKPVELFFYPYGHHPLDTPFERMASLQRNVDWFRFWMQGYEGSSPSYDPAQYQRWRALKHPGADALPRTSIP